jgi:zeaxanthin glucosyltransferase
MSKIVFIADLEEGHLLPSFGLANSLKRRGHEVVYLSVIDNEQLIKEQGFEFYSLFEDLYPKGFRQTIKKTHAEKLNGGDIKKDAILKRYMHAEQIMKGGYDSFLGFVKADIILATISLTFDAFILYYKYNIKAAILNPGRVRKAKSVASDCLTFINGLTFTDKCTLIEFLTERNIDFNSMEKLVEPLNKLHEFSLCPIEFEVDPTPMPPNIHCIESSIRHGNSLSNIYELYNIPDGKKLIYASLGSQGLRHGVACDVFFGKMINIIKYPEFQHMHLILNVDREYDINNLGEVPQNVTILHWAPQIDILKVTSVAIIHGGLGSVKECIYYGVPMIVFPQGYDQPSNAASIAHHNLGFVDNIRTISEGDLKSYIFSALTDTKIKSSIQKMRAIFQEQEKKGTGAEIIEEIMAKIKDPKSLTV